MEQVCRALADICRGWLRRQRGTNEVVNLLAVIVYHQQRNRMLGSPSREDLSWSGRGRAPPSPQKTSKSIDSPFNVAL